MVKTDKRLNENSTMYVNECSSARMTLASVAETMHLEYMCGVVVYSQQPAV